MIPLRDTIPARRFPIVNTAIIGLNVLVFLFEIALGPEQQDRFIWLWGLVPAQFWQGGGLGTYVMLYPRARVITLVSIFYFIRIVEIPKTLILADVARKAIAQVRARARSILAEHLPEERAQELAQVLSAQISDLQSLVRRTAVCHC
jgi:hypothetical protein